MDDTQYRVWEDFKEADSDNAVTFVELIDGADDDVTLVKQPDGSIKAMTL